MKKRILIITVAIISLFIVILVPKSNFLTSVRAQSSVIINWTTNSLNWGTGSVQTGKAFCTFDTSNDSALNCSGFTAVNGPLVIENTGTVDVKLNLSSNKNASAFIQGTNPKFQWKLANNETNSCAISASLNFTLDFSDVNTTTHEVCSNFESGDTADTINVDLFVRIPSDAPATAKTATITATAADIGGGGGGCPETPGFCQTGGPFNGCTESECPYCLGIWCTTYCSGTPC